MGWITTSTREGATLSLKTVLITSTLGEGASNVPMDWRCPLMSLGRSVGRQVIVGLAKRA